MVYLIIIIFRKYNPYTLESKLKSKLKAESWLEICEPVEVTIVPLNDEF